MTTTVPADMTIGAAYDVTIRRAKLVHDAADDNGGEHCFAYTWPDGTPDHVWLHPDSPDVTITPTSDEPSGYWPELAAALRRVADRIATISDHPAKPSNTNLTVYAGWSAADADRTMPLVDAIAAALGVTASPHKDATGPWHRAELVDGPLSVIAKTRVPEPEDPALAAERVELERLRAENARLRAEVDAGPHRTPAEWLQHPDFASPTPVEHQHVGGSAGGPGENSAECACGTVFAGFDTHAEATDLLDRHIADRSEPEPVRGTEDGTGAPLPAGVAGHPVGGTVGRHRASAVDFVIDRDATAGISS